MKRREFLKALAGGTVGAWLGGLVPQLPGPFHVGGFVPDTMPAVFAERCSVIPKRVLDHMSVGRDGRLTLGYWRAIEHGPNEPFVLVSDDEGKTWERHSGSEVIINKRFMPQSWAEDLLGKTG